MSTLTHLQTTYKHLYETLLPNAATSKSPVQPQWPVHVDHCFARIILDNVVGEGKRPWMEVLKSPAYKNMSEEQLRKCIALGEGILEGKEDLVELDERSLRVRGKNKGRGRRSKEDGKEGVGVEEEEEEEVKEEDNEGEKKEVVKEVKEKKNTKREGDVSKYFTKTHLGKRNRSEVLEHSEQNDNTDLPFKKPKSSSPSSPTLPSKPLTHYLSLITSSPTLTPYRKRVLTLLCQVPRGSYTTYGLMAAHLKSSARAVGNAMRNNPFAPQVPCHRVLATGGGIGGFHGVWGGRGKDKGNGKKEGENDEWKRNLLREEGVRFDGKGKVVGSPWNGFK